MYDVDGHLRLTPTPPPQSPIKIMVGGVPNSPPLSSVTLASASGIPMYRGLPVEQTDHYFDLIRYDGTKGYVGSIPRTPPYLPHQYPPERTYNCVDGVSNRIIDFMRDADGNVMIKPYPSVNTLTI